MKKKILVSVLVLFLLSGAAIGAYMMYDYNGHKPLILKCTVTESPAGSDVGSYKLLLIGEGLAYWSFADEEWLWGRADIGTFTEDKNSFSWNEGELGQVTRTEINRNSGDYFVNRCGSQVCTADYAFDVPVEKGNCIKSAEPAKTLKQKF